MDALALSDRFLRNGASDQLLQLVIERREEVHSNSAQHQGFGGRNIWSNSWQYCLRLKDKQLAARLALRYVNNFFFMVLWDSSYISDEGFILYASSELFKIVFPTNYYWVNFMWIPLKR